METNAFKNSKKQDYTNKPSYISINSYKVKSAILVISAFIPLGENGIISLVDKFEKTREIIIDETDLYYYIRGHKKDSPIIVEIYSRGLIIFSTKTKETRLGALTKEISRLKRQYYILLRKILTEYQLSLIDVTKGIDNIPVHMTIGFDSFDESSFYYIDTQKSIGQNEEEFNEGLLKTLASDITIKNFLGMLRSLNSNGYEDVIIGVNGSIIRSSHFEILLPYHAYIRSLHLFLNKFNIIIEEEWKALDGLDKELNYLNDIFEEEALKYTSFGDRFISLFSYSQSQQRLRTSRQLLITVTKDLDQIPIITNFIIESIEFTMDKYLIERKANSVYANEFHIRKTLKVLADRTKHLSIVAGNLNSRGKALLDQFELFHSELITTLNHRIEALGVMIAIFGAIVTIVALLL